MAFTTERFPLNKTVVSRDDRAGFSLSAAGHKSKVARGRGRVGASCIIMCLIVSGVELSHDDEMVSRKRNVSVLVLTPDFENVTDSRQKADSVSFARMYYLFTVLSFWGEFSLIP